MRDRIEQVARICYEANRAYCATIGDNTQLPWDQAEEWQRISARNGARLHLDRLPGVAPSPSASHDSWLAEKLANGWKYGPVKDPAKKEHPCCVPYDQLSMDDKLKDYIFAGICAAFYHADRA